MTSPYPAMTYPEHNIFEVLARIGELADLPDDLARTLYALARYYPNIWPSGNELARQLGLKRRATIDRLNRLTDLGYLTTEHRKVGPTFRAERTLHLPAHGSNCAALDCTLENSDDPNCASLDCTLEDANCAVSAASTVHPWTAQEEQEKNKIRIRDIEQTTDRCMGHILGYDPTADRASIRAAIERSGLDAKRVMAKCRAACRAYEPDGRPAASIFRSKLLTP